MTRENYPAAQSAARRAASLLTGALLIAGLAGCGGSLLQFSDSADASLKAKPATKCKECVLESPSTTSFDGPGVTAKLRMSFHLCTLHARVGILVRPR